MRPLIPCLAFLLAAAPSVALAVPAQLTTQGRVLDSTGAPLEDTVDVTFRLMDGESGGTTLWEELQTVTFTSGFYTVMLGADESGNPLEGSVLDQWPLYLEVQLDGEPAMVPRMAVGSVPYARQAGVAAELAPGADIEAGSLTVDGTEVVASDGTWTGPTPSVDWGELTGVPGDFSDGDDADTLADLVCSDGQWAVFDAATAAWACDGFSDSTLTDADVVVAVGTDAVDLYAGSTMDGYTILTEDAEIDWSQLVSLPAGLDDGDDDTLAGLVCTDGQVAVYDAAGTAWVCGDDDTLSEAEVEAYVTNDPLDLPAGTTVDGVSLGDSATPAVTVSSSSSGAVELSYGGSSITVDGVPELREFLWASDLQTTAQCSHSTQFECNTWCALSTSNTVHCSRPYWGGWDTHTALDAVFQMRANTYSMLIEACLLDASGEVWCNTLEAGEYQAVSGSGYTQLAGAVDDGCALATDGSTACWGSAGLSGSFTQIEGNDLMMCGITAAGGVSCRRHDGLYSFSTSGSFGWVTINHYYACAGDSAGATYCWDSTGAQSSVSGNWSTFSAQLSHPSSPTRGCGVLSTGGMRCIDSAGTTVDHGGDWKDLVLQGFSRSRSSSTNAIPVGITQEGRIFNPGPM